VTAASGPHRTVEGAAERSDAALWTETLLLAGGGLLTWYWSAISCVFWPQPRLPPREAFMWFETTRLAAGLSVIAMVVLVIWRSAEPWTRFGVRRPAPAADGVLALILLCAYIPVTRLIEWTAGCLLSDPLLWTTPERVAALLPVPERASEWVIGGLALTASAAAEEFLLRGLLIIRLERLLGSSWKAVVLAAAVFAGYHAYQGFSALLSIFVFGILYGAAFALRRSLLPLVVAHAATNALYWLGFR
jgi:membrane protease YdiL (CAAX protease family)